MTSTSTSAGGGQAGRRAQLPSGADFGLSHGRGGLPGLRREERLPHLLPGPEEPRLAQLGHTEAACAGALGLQLGGTHDYFGKPVVKPTIGDDLRAVTRGDVAAANRLALTTALLALLIFDVLPLAAFGRLFGW